MIDTGPTRQQEARELVVVNIEDNPVNQRLIATLLARQTIHLLHTAGTGQQGLDLCARLDPDVVLVDLNLPDIQGSEIVRRLAHDRHTGRPIIAVITADNSPSRDGELRALGADHYLTKPLDVHRLLDLLARAATPGGG
jgi:CheY-like chemotaxis protein